MPDAAKTETKRAVAAAVRREDGRVLAVRRPDEPGEELPGVWGLPAVTLREGESPEDGVLRLGREKLGVDLTPLESLAEGEQRRDGYVLHMNVFAASITGEPRLPPRTGDNTATLYEAIDWLEAPALQPAAEAGSLCCELFLAPHPRPSPASGRGGEIEENSNRRGQERLRIPPGLRRRMIEVARAYRKEPTRSESMLWQELRNRKLNDRKFRRQRPIGPFVVDFYCAQEQLVVEVDGPIHTVQRAADQERQELLEKTGVRVVRISDEQVENDIESVLTIIRSRFRPS